MHGALASSGAVRFASGALLLVLIFAGAFALARASTIGRSRLDPIRLVNGVPVGMGHSEAGALAAADNYVAVGISDSLDQKALESFAQVDVAARLRASLLQTNEQLSQRSGPPTGTRAVGLVVANRLRGYSGDIAQVTTWEAGDYWGAQLAPTQYWALADLLLHWHGGRWQIVSLQEHVPGPVPARIATRGAASSDSYWNIALAGMTAPYYGAG